MPSEVNGFGTMRDRVGVLPLQCGAAERPAGRLKMINLIGRHSVEQAANGTQQRREGEPEAMREGLAHCACHAADFVDYETWLTSGVCSFDGDRLTGAGCQNSGMALCFSLSR